MTPEQELQLRLVMLEIQTIFAISLAQIATTQRSDHDACK